MADDDRPTPPPELEDSIGIVLEQLARQDPSQLPAVAAYVEELAAWTESSGGPAGSDTEEKDESESSGDADAPAPAGAETDSPPSAETDVPPGVPERASVTVTEIGGTEYRYYQWRDGDEIRSKTVER